MVDEGHNHLFLVEGDDRVAAFLGEDLDRDALVVGNREAADATLGFRLLRLPALAAERFPDVGIVEHDRTGLTRHDLAPVARSSRPLDREGGAPRPGVPAAKSIPQPVTAGKKETTSRSIGHGSHKLRCLASPTGSNDGSGTVDSNIPGPISLRQKRTCERPPCVRSTAPQPKSATSSLKLPPFGGLNTSRP